MTPDLTTLGKAIANGYPLAALCGKAEYMNHCGPGGDVFFAGTFNAHPMNVSAALATIETLEQPGSYEHLFGPGERMRAGLRELVADSGTEATVAGFGSVFLLYFISPPLESYTVVVNARNRVFVKVEMDQPGLIGWGEATLEWKTHQSLARLKTSAGLSSAKTRCASNIFPDDVPPVFLEEVVNN